MNSNLNDKCLYEVQFDILEQKFNQILESIERYNKLVDQENRSEEEEIEMKVLYSKINSWNLSFVEPLIVEFKRLTNLGVDKLEDPEKYLIGRQ